MKYNEFFIKSATICILLGGLFYAGYMNQTIKPAVGSIDRGILIIIFIYGVYKIASEVPLYIYKKIRGGGNGNARRS